MDPLAADGAGLVVEHFGRHAVYPGDCIEFMRSLPDASVDSIVTDPPYGLGFMGRAWDASTPGLEWARECLRVLKPGGHIVAFGGTRTYHRLAVAIEDAGFEIRDSFVWLYGSGFPKSHDVSKAIDRAAGAEREVVGSRIVSRDFDTLKGEDVAFRSGRPGSTTIAVTAPATPDAARWAGWGTALKPAHEPAVLARKPMAGTVAANVREFGTGAINVDGCRVAFDDAPSGTWGARQTASVGYNGGTAGRGFATARHDSGRWPANVIHNGDDAAVDVLGSAARYFYCAKASTAERAGSKHPTVKPLALMRYLVRLVTPPGGVVLDTFLGSGTTMLACEAEGLTCLGAEREHIADVRLRWGKR